MLIKQIFSLWISLNVTSKVGTVVGYASNDRWVLFNSTNLVLTANIIVWNGT